MSSTVTSLQRTVACSLAHTPPCTALITLVRSTVTTDVPSPTMAHPVVRASTPPLISTRNGPHAATPLPPAPVTCSESQTIFASSIARTPDFFGSMTITCSSVRLARFPAHKAQSAAALTVLDRTVPTASPPSQMPCVGAASTVQSTSSNEALPVAASARPISRSFEAVSDPPSRPSEPPLISQSSIDQPGIARDGQPGLEAQPLAAARCRRRCSAAA